MTIGANALQILASCVPGQDISAILGGMPAGIRDPHSSTTVRRLEATAAARRFAPRRYQCSPDREASRNRRRMLARGGHMPPDVRVRYTEGEASALTIIAREIKHHSVCDLPIDKIAAMAGVCRTTVQNAIREAVKRGHITVERRPVNGRKNLTNLIRIASPEWEAWLKRGPTIGFKTLLPKILSPTKIQRFTHRPEQAERLHGIRLESG
jgi:DNA-binding MarR family transcriptional regulator